MPAMEMIGREAQLRALCSKHGVDFDVLVLALSAPDDESAMRVMQGSSWSDLFPVFSEAFFSGTFVPAKREV